MSKADAFLNWWLHDSVVDICSKANETAVSAHRLPALVPSATTRLAMDEQDPAFTERLYERVIDAIGQAKSDLSHHKTAAK